MKTKIWKNLLLSFALCAGAATFTDAKAQMLNKSAVERASEKYTEEQKVNYLIQYIAKMENATFIRNGSEHTCKQAAEHLESKWEKHKDDVKTANGFVEELASRSGLTGEPYKIRFADGTTKTTNQVLLKALQQLQ
ncbi:DUF5329 family protein [Pontibacter oryzae]|uniref:DUF5329 domain-containing protein n=1 Tax=Pontibacter oryzae TaxID=2304593 RepID=A0A399RYR8_9BACT|nr:DUF5329 family protein [Pontibacter oryzae]RIJ36916.1 hypothetical protein D1627_13920 [Pontibacter oryzae]